MESDKDISKWQGYMWYDGIGLKFQKPKVVDVQIFLKETQHWPTLTKLMLLFKESTFRRQKKNITQQPENTTMAPV